MSLAGYRRQTKTHDCFQPWVLVEIGSESDKDHGSVDYYDSGQQVYLSELFRHFE